MGSCFSELNLRPKTATSSQSTVVGDEGPSTSLSLGKNDGAGKEQLQKSSDLSKESNEKLIAWLAEHLDHPYPSEAEKEDLARQAGLDSSESRRKPSSRLLRYLQYLFKLQEPPTKQLYSRSSISLVSRGPCRSTPADA